MKKWRPTDADMAVVKGARAVVEEASRALQSARERLHLAVLAAWRCPPGTRVIDRRGIELEVVGPNAGYHDGQPWLRGHRVLRNGRLHKQNVTIYDGWSHKETPQ